MVDNVAVTPGTGATFATDDIGGVHFPRVKISQGADGSGTDVSSAAPLNVTLANGTVPSHAVTNAGTFATQATLAAETTKNIGTVRVGDGTNTAAVKAASTAPVANDPAVVVSISPNSVNANGQATMANSAPVVIASNQSTLPTSNTNLTNFGAGEYETVAASQTAQTLGATGATGDYISGLLVVPATTSPGNVLLLDNATSITVFAGGASSVSNLVPFFIPLGMISVSGAWKVTTGSNVSVIGIGNFT